MLLCHPFWPLIVPLLLNYGPRGIYPQSACASESSESLRSGANDVIVVRQEDKETLASTPFQVQVGKFSNFFSFWKSREGKEVQIFVNGVLGPRSLVVMDSGAACFQGSKEDGGDPVWSSEEWGLVPLRRGGNMGVFHVPELDLDIHFRIYLYDQEDRFVVADVDGTITESDLKGHLYSAIGSSAHHDDVIPLLSSIQERGYHIIYLTARSLAQDDETRSYLFKTLGSEGLPRGPLLLSPKPFGEALLDSTVGSPRDTKARTLRQVISLFTLGPEVIVGAYGNRQHDSQAYQDAGIAAMRIYLVNPAGQLVRITDPNNEMGSYRDQRKNINALYPKRYVAALE